MLLQINGKFTMGKTTDTDTDTDTDASALYLGLYLEIDSDVGLRTKNYDKKDYYNFPIVNFPFICSNIPAATAYVDRMCGMHNTTGATCGA
jgi:hypothetical protein